MACRSASHRLIPRSITSSCSWIWRRTRTSCPNGLVSSMAWWTASRPWYATPNPSAAPSIKSQVPQLLLLFRKACIPSHWGGRLPRPPMPPTSWPGLALQSRHQGRGGAYAADNLGSSLGELYHCLLGRKVFQRTLS